MNQTIGKDDLVTKVAQRSGTQKATAERVIDSTVEVITEEVAAGNKIQLVGFGSFAARHRDARVGTNPRDGQPMQIAAQDVPFFAPGKSFKDALKIKK